jgi:hypothetical protein
VIHDVLKSYDMTVEQDVYLIPALYLNPRFGAVIQSWLGFIVLGRLYEVLIQYMQLDLKYGPTLMPL